MGGGLFSLDLGGCRPCPLKWYLGSTYLSPETASACSCRAAALRIWGWRVVGRSLKTWQLEFYSRCFSLRYSSGPLHACQASPTLCSFSMLCCHGASCATIKAMTNKACIWGIDPASKPR